MTDNIHATELNDAILDAVHGGGKGGKADDPIEGGRGSEGGRVDTVNKPVKTGRKGAESRPGRQLRNLGARIRAHIKNRN